MSDKDVNMKPFKLIDSSMIRTVNLQNIQGASSAAISHPLSSLEKPTQIGKFDLPHNQKMRYTFQQRIEGNQKLDKNRSPTLNLEILEEEKQSIYNEEKQLQSQQAVSNQRVSLISGVMDLKNIK